MADLRFFAASIERHPDGAIVLVEIRKANSEIAAKCLAAAMLATNAGAVAFSRLGDNSSDDPVEVAPLAVYGELADGLPQAA
jgi:hypothetical protein